MSGLMAFVIAVCIVAAIALGVCFVCGLGNWLSHKSSWTSRVKFKQWLELYYLNPGEWCLDDTPNRYVGKGFGGGHWVYIHFSFFDFLRYQAWKEGNKRRKTNTKRDKYLKEVLEAAQSDIEKLKSQADFEMEKARKQVEQTARRVNTTTRTSSGEVTATNSGWKSK